jgi:hypothetical protein
MKSVSSVCAVAAVVVVAAASAAPQRQPGLTFDAPVEGLALAHGSLWVSVASDDLVLRLDARTGRRLARILVHRANPRALSGGNLAAGWGKIWIAAPVRVKNDPAVGDASGWIGRLDPRTRELDLVQVHGSDRPTYVAVGSSGVWVSGFHALWRVDPASGRITAKTRFDRYVGAVAVTRHAVWVAGSNTGFVKEIDPRTLHVRAMVSVGPSRAGSSLAVVGNRVWAATDRGLVGIDASSARIVARVHLPQAGAVAFDGSRLWALAPGGVYAVQGHTATRWLPLSSPVYGLLVAGPAGVWFTDEATNSLRRVAGKR